MRKTMKYLGKLIMSSILIVALLLPTAEKTFAEYVEIVPATDTIVHHSITRSAVVQCTLAWSFQPWTSSGTNHAYFLVTGGAGEFFSAPPANLQLPTNKYILGMNVDGIDIGATSGAVATDNLMVQLEYLGDPVPSYGVFPSPFFAVEIRIYDSGDMSTPIINYTYNYTAPQMTVKIPVEFILGQEPAVYANYAPIVNDEIPLPASDTSQYDYQAGYIADADFVSEVGQPYNITDGLRAKLGYTAGPDMTLITGSTPTGNEGLVTEEGTPPPTSGGNFATMGIHNVTQKITDSDGDSTTFNRNFVIKSITPPTLVADYASGAIQEDGTSIGGNAYGGEWTNQPLKLIAESTDVATYDTTIQSEATYGMDDWGELSRTPGDNHTIDPYLTESPVDGRNLVAELFEAGGTPGYSLSPKSAPINVKIDITDPTFVPVEPADYSTATAIAGANDTLSGLENGTGGVYYMFTPSTVVVPPLYTDAGWSTNYTTAYDALTPGSHNLWAYAKDNATNKSAVKLVNVSDEIEVLSEKEPTISGATITKPVVTSGSWVNEDLVVTVSKPSDMTGVPTPNKVKMTSPSVLDILAVNKLATNATDLTVDETYSKDTDGLIVTGVIVKDPEGINLTQSATYTVMIDKTAPTAKGSVANTTGNSYVFADNGSTENVASNGATGSGIATGSTKFAVVPEGDAAPSDYDDYNISEETKDLSSVGAGTFDIYTVVKDNAGNVSTPVLADGGPIVIVNDDVNKKPIIAGAYSTLSGNGNVANSAYTSGDWSNVPIDLTGSKGAGSYAGDHNVDINVGGSVVATGTGNVGASVNHSANVEGTTSYDSLVVNTNSPKEALSLASDAFVVKIDTQAPTSDLLSTDNWLSITDNSIDDTSVTTDVSGIYKTYVKYVLADEPAPTISEGGWSDVGTSAASLTSAGVWDVYSYSVDGAGNKSAVKNEDNDIEVASSNKPLISAVYTTGATDKDGNVIAANTPYDGAWTNDSVDITVATTDTASGLYGALYADGVSTPFGSDALSALRYTHVGYATQSATNAGTDIIGKIASNATLTVLSQASDVLNIKIDKTIPEAKATFVEATCEIVDASTDTLSGIDDNKTKVAIVSHNATEPIASAFNDFVTGMTIPQDGGYYDIYMMVTDNAGNESAITKVLTNRSSNPTDAINASDFERGLNEGTMVDADAKALADVSGNYYYTSGSPLPILVSDILVDGPKLGAINTNITNGILGANDLTFKTPVGTYQEQADIKVTIYKHGDSGSNPGDERIYGNDFMYAISQGGISEASAKALAAILAREGDLSVMDLDKVIVTQSELDDINDAIANKDSDNNTWPLTFTTPDGASVNVAVSLFDNVGPNPPIAGQEIIAANNFNFGMDQGDLDATLAKELAKVYAEDLGVAIPLTSITVLQTDLDTINAAIVAKDKSGNPFDVTFIAPGGTSVTAKVTLFDHINPPVVGNAKIVANDFPYGIDNGNMDDDLAKILSQVAAIDAIGKKIDISNIAVDATQLQVINDAIDDGKSGAYDLTFTEPSGEEVTISVTLYNNSNPEPPQPNSESIYANDFSYGISSGLLNANDAKILANVYAQYDNGGVVDLADINIKLVDLAVINAAISAKDKSGNPFDLTFVSPAGKEVSVKVTLKDNGPEGPFVKGDEYITGNNFGYGINQGALSAADVMYLAKIDPRHADGSLMNLSDVTVDGTELQAINDAITAGDKSGNPFDLTFTTIGGVSVSVEVTLYDNSNPVQPGKATIVGNDFTYGISQGALSDGLARLYANAKAVDKDGNDILATDIIVDAVELDAINTAISNKDKSGNPFTLTFTEPSGEEVSVKVTLKDNGDGPEDEDNNSERIAADDFFYGISEGALSAKQAKALADVVAFEKGGNAMDLSKVNVEASDLAILNAAIAANNKSGNPFTLTFTTPDGTSTSVQVILKDNTGGVKDPDDSSNDTDRIGADDFFYGIDQGALDADDAKLLANVEAVDKDGNPIDLTNVTTDPAQLSDINKAIQDGKLGDYPLTFTTPSGVDVEVNVTLKNKGDGEVDPSDPTNPNTNTDRIAGNDFIYGINEGELSEEEAKIRAQVEAVDKEGKEIPLADIVADAAELKVINDAIAKGATGNYPLTYETDGGAKITVTVTLKDHSVKPDVDPHDDEKTTSGNIGANNFIVGANEANTLTADEAKLRSRVVAKDAFGNEYPLSVISVNASELQTINNAKVAGQTGEFPLTFTSPEGKSVTISVRVLKKAVPPEFNTNDGKNEGSIGANDFNHGRNEGSLSGDKAKELANVTAKDKDGNNIPREQIKVDQAQLDKLNEVLKNGETGTFPLTFTEPDGKKVTVDVTIYDTVIHNEDPDNQQEFGGNDFKHDTEDGKLTEDKAKELAEIYAKDELGLDIPWDQIHIDKDDLDKLNDAIANGETGEFELKFTTDDGQELTVKVTLFSSKTPEKPTPTKTPDQAGNGSDTNGTGNGNNGTGNGNNGTGNGGSSNQVTGNNYMLAKGVNGVKTGDMAAIGLWMALALATGGTIILVVMRRRKRQQ